MCLLDRGFTRAPLPDSDTGQLYWEINAGDPQLPLLERVGPECERQRSVRRQQYLAAPHPSPSAAPLASLATLIDQAAYAQCLRDHGVADYPNPDPDTAAIAYTAAGDAAPKVVQSGQTCQEAVARAPRYVSHTRLSPPSGLRTVTGVLDAAGYRIEVPRSWNGTLLLYSHGYQPPVGSVSRTDTAHIEVAPTDNSDTENWLLQRGYALAASAYSQTGWAVQQAITDQLDLLDLFTRRVGRPARTIAVGESMGGLITTGLIERYPDRFDAGVAMCGVVAGSVSSFQQGLDGLFVLRTLLDPRGAAGVQFPVVKDPARQLEAIQHVLAAAQATPAGRARLAMVAAVLDLPAVSAGPDATEQQQMVWLRDIWASFLSYAFAEAVSRGGGDPAGNTSVDYGTLLRQSADDGEVAALYRDAGLDLDADLARLARAPRVAADQRSVAYFQRYLQPTGVLRRPLLTVHDTGDPTAVVQEEQSYAQQVAGAGSQGDLRQLFVDRQGHCRYTPAEAITAVHQVEYRLDSGGWGDLRPAQLDMEAAALGKGLNAFATAAPPAFVTYTPAYLPRSAAPGQTGG